MRRNPGLGMPSLVGTVCIHWCPDPPRLLLLEVPPFHFLDYGRPGGAYDGRCDYVFFPGLHAKSSAPLSSQRHATSGGYGTGMPAYRPYRSSNLALKMPIGGTALYIYQLVVPYRSPV